MHLTVNWGSIHRALSKMEEPAYIIRVMYDYLKNRICIYETERDIVGYKVTGVVP